MPMERFIFSILISGCFILSCQPQMEIRTITKTIRDTVVIKETKIISTPPKYTSAHLEQYEIDDAHFPSIGQDFRQKILVLHYTALPEQKSIRVLTEQQVSSHYLVTDAANDKINLLVSEDHRAWHAGVSHWGKRDNLNDSSIGIEIVNEGYYIEQDTLMKFYPYPEHQFKKVAILCQDIVNRYKIEPQDVVAHSDIAPQRKQDPGAMFPWKRLYDEYQVGAWYDEADKTYFIHRYRSNKINDVRFILSVQDELEEYGYQISKSGIWDKQTKKVLRAFQMHFRPENYNGYLDAETWAILKALNKKYRE